MFEKINRYEREYTNFIKNTDCIISGSYVHAYILNNNQYGTIINLNLSEKELDVFLNEIKLLSREKDTKYISQY